MRSIIKLILLLIVFTLSSCSIEPVPIEYGKDACHFCKMNIVDKQHAAEIVTQKGKPFKYDAVECMMREIKVIKESEIAIYLITDYTSPGKLVDATKATYLISENIPSPMGANLSGFEKTKDAEQTIEEKGGTLYSWEELKELF